MKAYRPEKAPDDFTVNVMNRIFETAKPISEYKPVLNKWFLCTVYAAFSVFLIYGLFFGNSNTVPNSGQPTFWDKVVGYLPSFDFSAASHTGGQLMENINKIPTVVVAIFISATLLLLLDQILLRRKKVN